MSTQLARMSKKQVKIQKRIDMTRKNLEMVQSKIDLGTLMPSQQVYTPDLYSVMEFIDNIIERYAMMTDIFAFPDFVCPSAFGLYLQMAFLVYIKKHGQLTGTFAGLVPLDFSEWAIPLAFAHFLEGFGEYIEDGCSNRMVLDHSLSLGVSVPYWGAGDGSNNLVTNLVPNNRTFWPTGWQIAIMFPANDVDLFPVTTTGPYSVTEAQFAALTLQVISEAISSSGLAYVAGKEIRGVAPDASAYTSINMDVSVIPNPSCYYFLGINDKYNVESALIYNKHNPLSVQAAASARIFSKKCICCGTDDVDNAAPWYLQPGKTYVFIKSTASKFKHGPMNKIKYCNTKLKTLFPVPQILDWRGFANLVLRHYAACYSTYPYNATVVLDNNLHKLTAFIIVCQMALWARFTRVIPYWRNYFNVVGSSFYCPQSFYATPSWMAVRLPVSIVDCIGAVGPVVYRGRLYYPHFPTRNVNSGTYPQTPGPVWSMGVGGYRVDDSPSPFAFGINIGGVTPIISNPQLGNNYAISLNAKTSIMLSNYSVPATAGTYPLFTLNFHSESLYRIFDTFHSNMSTNASMNASLVHQHYEKCGASYMLLVNMTGSVAPVFGTVTGHAYELLLSPDDINNDPILGSLSTSLLELTKLSSLVQLGMEDTVLAIVYGMALHAQNGLTAAGSTDGKFVLQLSASTSNALLLENLIQATYMAGSTFVCAISKREAVFNDVMATGVITATLPADKDGCFIKKLFKGAVRILGAPLRLGVSVAAGAVCGMGVSALGAPMLEPAASMLCSTGANKVMDYIGSRLGIDSNDIDTPARSNQISVRGKTEAINNIASQIKTFKISPDGELTKVRPPVRIKGPPKRMDMGAKSKVAVKGKKKKKNKPEGLLKKLL